MNGNTPISSAVEQRLRHAIHDAMETRHPATFTELRVTVAVARDIADHMDNFFRSMLKTDHEPINQNALDDAQLIQLFKDRAFTYRGLRIVVAPDIEVL